jgi:succinate dehydrogenase / fumarate reductase membrane anchor subunit
MSRHASGFKAWYLQRVSALYLLVFTLYLLQHLTFHAPKDYLAWRDWVALPWVRIGLLLFFASLLLHAWIGIRDILIDYVHHTVARVSILTLIGFILIGCALWVLSIIVQVPVA